MALWGAVFLLAVTGTTVNIDLVFMVCFAITKLWILVTLSSVKFCLVMHVLNDFYYFFL